MTNTQHLNRMLESTVLLSWSQLMPDPEPGLIHVEYKSGADGLLEYFKVWASTVRGVWHLVCDFWVRPMWSNPAGMHLGPNYNSADFARALELVVGSENSPIAPNVRGLVQVYPPSAVQLQQARRTTSDILSHQQLAPPVKSHAA